MSRYLMIDFGSTFTKLTAVDTECEDIIATASHFTTVDTDITVGYKNALSDLCKKLGEESPKFDKIIGCSSAAGGLKMAAVGLVRELTVEAARRVCLGVFSLDGKMVDKPVIDRAEKILRKAKAYKLI